MSQQDAGGLAASTARPTPAAQGDGSVPAQAERPHAGGASLPRWLTGRRWVQEVIVLVAFLAAGVAVTWPRATFITGTLPFNADQTQYVWSLWWVARQITHLANPWYTNYLAAPVGVQLGFDTLTPLLGIVMTPVTLLFGPSASYNLLVIVAPGLAGYAMYRAARLWLPGRIGPIAAGAFFGLSSMLTSQAWDHIHTALGAVFLPLALEAAVRLRRAPTVGRGILLGLVIGLSMMVDQEATVLATVIAALVLIGWLWRRPGLPALRALAAGAVAALVVAGPQLLAMAQESGRGGPLPPPSSNYLSYAAELPGLFSPSPSLHRFGLSALASSYNVHTNWEMAATFGVVLSALALLGLIVSWRRPASRKLALLWLGSAILALGPTLYIGSREYVPLAQAWHGIRVSMLMPYTWLIRLPVLSSFREADRLAFLGLVGAALLAGAAVEWLRVRAWPLIIVVAILGALEAGWSGDPGQVTISTTLPALDRPIAADHSHSVVVDVPFVVRGPTNFGLNAATYSLALATADGHPRGMAITSAVPERTIDGIARHPFYAALVAVQKGKTISPARLAAVRRDLRTLNVGWVLVWTPRWGEQGTPNFWPGRMEYPQIQAYLAETGFRFDYEADGVLVYRPAAALPPGARHTVAPQLAPLPPRG